jgi:hypothetical protein
MQLQPHLLKTDHRDASVIDTSVTRGDVRTLLAPQPQMADTLRGR